MMFPVQVAGDYIADRSIRNPFSFFQEAAIPYVADYSILILIWTVVMTLPYAFVSAQSFGLFDYSVSKARAIVVARTRDIISFAVMMVGLMIMLPVALGWLFIHVPYLDYIAGASGVVGLLSIMYLLIKRSWPIIRDWVRQRSMNRVLPVTRRQIADALEKFDSGSGRKAYIQWLSSRIVDLDVHMRNPNDRWPNDSRPNYENDESSAMLARLDERWLALSR
jgi:hypothetical protein